MRQLMSDEYQYVLNANTTDERLVRALVCTHSISELEEMEVNNHE